MEILKRIAATALVCGAAGCEFLREPTFIDPPDDLLQVHSVLHGGADTVKVLVSRSGVSGSQSVVTLVSGARVRIAGGGAEVTLREAPAGFSGCVNRFDPMGPNTGEPVMGPGCYAAVLPGGVRPGERYLLTVELTDGTRVTGETVVPTLPEIVRPTERERLLIRRLGDGTIGRLDSLLVRWRIGPGLAASFPIGQGGTVYRGGHPVTGGECQVVLFGRDYYVGAPARGRIAPDDSTRVEVQVGGCRTRTATSATALRPDSLDAVFMIAAQDSASARYAHMESDAGIRKGAGAQGLRGAYGLFGSRSTGTRRVRLVFTTP